MIAEEINPIAEQEFENNSSWFRWSSKGACVAANNAGAPTTTPNRHERGELMKPRIALPPQREPVALPFHPDTFLVDIACLLRTRRLRLRWNVQRRALEVIPVD
jgi:hypothetical protein